MSMFGQVYVKNNQYKIKGDFQTEIKKGRRNPICTRIAVNSL